MTRKTILLATMLMLAGCESAAGPVAKAPNPCVGTVTRVTSQPTRGGADWYVGVRDEKGTTHVCQATEKAQTLQTGDRVDGRDMWK